MSGKRCPPLRLPPRADVRRPGGLGGSLPEGWDPPTGTHPAALWATTRTTQKHPGGSRPPGTHLNTTEETTAP